MTVAHGAARAARGVVPSALRRVVLPYRNESPARRPTEVEPGIWIGGMPTRARWKVLQAAGVHRALSLMQEAEPKRWLGSAEALLWLPVPDTQPPEGPQIEAGCRFLDEARSAGTGVLVYCGSGFGRAPTLYAAWCLRREPGTDVADVLVRMRALRPVIAPTEAQLGMLRARRGTGPMRGR